MRMRGWLPLLLAILALFCADAVMAQRAENPSRQIRKMTKLFRAIERNYVVDIDITPYIEGAIEDITSQLDPFSRYLKQDDLRRMQSRFTRRVAGIGAEFIKAVDSIVVVKITPGSPAAVADLRPMDRITAIDGVSVVGSDVRDVIARMQGDPDTDVRLTVCRKSSDEPLEIDIRRAVIPPKSVTVSYAVSDSVGYIKLSSFTYNTVCDFDQALSNLEGVKTLIVDLTDNSGGIVAPAIEITGRFLKKNSVICKLQGQQKTGKYKSKGSRFDGNLILMVNSATASASELMAGALQDWDRAVIVGEPTFGKGVGQHTFKFDDGTALQLTTMQVVTPSGRTIQRPYEMGAYEKFYMGQYARVNNPDSLSLDSLTLPRYKTLRSKRIVYGLSGVQPDVVMKNFSRKSMEEELVEQNITFYLMNKYYGQILEQYPTCADFLAHFKASDEDKSRMQTFLKYIVSSPSVVEDAFATAILRVAYYIYPAEQYYPIYNATHSNIYRRALSLAEDWQRCSAILSVQH